MAPLAGPTAAVAMCAAAIVSWRKPMEQQQMSEPHVSDSTDDHMSNPDMVALHSSTVSNEMCEAAFLEDQTWQQPGLNIAHEQEFGDTSQHSLGDVDIATHNVVEQGSGHPLVDSFGGVAMEHDVVDQNSVVTRHDTSILMKGDVGVVMVEDDNFIPLINRESEKQNSALDNESPEKYGGQNNASICDQSACPSEPTETTVEISDSSFTARPTEATIDHNQDFPSVEDWAGVKLDTVFDSSQHDGDALEIHAEHKTPEIAVDITVDTDLASMQPHQSQKEAPTNISTESQEQASTFTDTTSEENEFILWLQQSFRNACQRIFSDDMLDMASMELHQRWQSGLASAQGVLGDDFITSISNHWWQVMCLASFCDMLLVGVFGRFVVRNISSSCCRSRRRDPVQPEVDVVVTSKKEDNTENLISDYDEQQQLVGSNSGTKQALAPKLDDVPCELACGVQGVEIAPKSQPNPFSSSIKATPTPARSRRGFCASSQNLVATSVSVEGS